MTGPADPAGNDAGRAGMGPAAPAGRPLAAPVSTVTGGGVAGAATSGQGPDGDGPAGMGSGSGQGSRRRAIAIFLGPAVVVLVALVVYPIVYTIWLSFNDARGSRFVGLDNYVAVFTAPETRQAIVNNVIWVLVAPTVVTALGMIFAVMTERVRLATALKVALFMPMAISFLAAGVTFRLVYDESPERGMLNAVTVAVHDVFAPPSPYYGAKPRQGVLRTVDGGYETATPVRVGTPALLPLVGLPTKQVPQDATPAVEKPQAGLSGVTWLDFTRGGGGTPGRIDPAEPGLPGMTVEAVRDGSVVATTTADSAGAFAFPELTSGEYQLRLPEQNFAPPFRGVTWLGPALVTPSIIGAYVWIWAGFAMVLIAAGLAALPRESLEAARVDGATEWQVFRRVTVPLMRPVLLVVLVTLVINVLKIFDLVLILAPESSQDDANVIALEMYRVSFGGGLNFGLGSALAVLLFLFVLPAMLFNLRRLRRGS